MRIAAAVSSFFLLLIFAPSSSAQTSWKNEWERVVKAAKGERRLTIYGVTVFEEVFKSFQKEYPEIINPKLGPEYIRKLYAEMDVTVSRDDAQMVDWAGRREIRL